MKNLILLFCLVCLSCGSKKNFSWSESSENIQTNEQLYAELYRDTRLLELFDIKIRQVETRDSSSNVRTETNVDISKKTDRQDLDTTKVTVNKQEEGEKIVNVETKEARSGVMSYWVWIVGFFAVIVVAVVVGIGVLKFKKKYILHE